jgi:hypothetical protein
MKYDDDYLVSVAGCGSVGEADMLIIALAEHGINASLEGGELNTALGHIGSALGDVKILVRASDAREAKAIVIATRESYVAPDQDPWFCGKCLEEVAGGFEICWCCSLVRVDVEAPFPATADAIELLDSPAVNTDDLGRLTGNPYESPQAIGAAEEKEKEVDPEVKAIEYLLLYALLFSVLCVVVPILPAFPALFAILSASKKGVGRSKRAKFTYEACVFTLLAANLIGICFWYYLSYGA